MKPTDFLKRATVVALALALAPAALAAAGYKYKILYNFGAGSDGTLPNGPLLLDAKGNLYGVTGSRGGSGCGGSGFGTVFGLTWEGSGAGSPAALPLDGPGRPKKSGVQ